MLTEYQNSSQLWPDAYTSSTARYALEGTVTGTLATAFGELSVNHPAVLFLEVKDEIGRTTSGTSGPAAGGL